MKESIHSLQAMAVTPEVLAELEDIMKAAHETGQVMQAYHKVMTVLTTNGLCREMRISPDEVGVSPRNRDGYGVSGPDAHELLDKIVEVGWSDRETSPHCVEVDMNAGSSIQAFNEKLMNQSSGLIPPLKFLRFASLAASHTNVALRALRHETRHPSGGQLCMDGKLSMARALSLDSNLAEAASNGMTWKVISHQVPSQILDLIQASQNTSSQLARGEHEPQLLKRIACMVASKKDVKWDAIKTRILSTKPSCATACPYMYTFIMKFYHEGFMNAMEARLKRCLKCKPQLGADFWQQISSDCKDARSQHLLFRYALLSMAYTSQSKGPSSSDVKRMLQTDASQEITACIHVLQRIRFLLAPFLGSFPNIDDANAVVTLHDHFEDTCVQHALAKQLNKDPITTLAHGFVKEVYNVTQLALTDEYGPAVEGGPKAAGQGGSQASEKTEQLGAMKGFRTGDTLMPCMARTSCLMCSSKAKGL